MRTIYILLIVCLLLPAPCLTIAADKPIIYTVKKGDTLWDISRRFIKDPFYWPNLWSHNPEVLNPHLIFPGQKLRIFDGRIEVIPTDEELAAEADATERAPAMASDDTVTMVGIYDGAGGFISVGDLATAGTLLDTVDNRYMISAGEKIFLEMNDLSNVRPGETYQLLEIGEKIKHPVNKSTVLGYRVTDLGTAKIMEITQSVAVAEVADVKREILRGARVRPYVEPPAQIPRKTADQVLLGYIVTAVDGRLALGSNDVIFIDLGTANGLEVGHELRIFRTRELTKAAKETSDHNVSLPQIELGSAIVVEVQENTAEALILETGNLPLYPGDRVVTITR
jgi:hypothetical protein